MTNTCCRFVLAIALGVSAATDVSLSAHLSAPDAFQTALDRYDRAPAGPARDALASDVDAAAHQKYATVSRLYWHTDLASAMVTARLTSRPILELRLLGRLDEDLSCANSRLFRATLYANADVSRFLGERFVLYWSTERPVPHVTIDYGDGRRLERTTTGNSAHYVLDEDGHVLDVLPGLYAPAAFLQQLQRSLALAGRVRGTSNTERGAAVVEYHEEQARAARREWALAIDQLPMRAVQQVLTQSRDETALAAAQRVTMSKALIELPDLRAIARGLAPESLPADDVLTWALAGSRLWPATVLDEASRELVIRLHNAVAPELRVTGVSLDRMVARLEQTILADTALNHLRLRPDISREIVRRRGDGDFVSLNAWIYAEVFRTPADDPWLGLAPRDVFTGVPGDGIEGMQP